MRNILVTGCDGQLGSEFKDLEENYSELNFFSKFFPAPEKPDWRFCLAKSFCWSR